MLAENNLNVPPIPGHQFFIATIRATYLGTTSAKFLASFRLRAVGSSAVTYSTFQDSCRVIPNALPERKVVFPGDTTVEGNICWSVTAADADVLVMYDDEALSLSEHRAFSLALSADPIFFAL